MISTSPIRISCVVPGDRVPEAVEALHGAFELSGEGHDPAGAARSGSPPDRDRRVAVVGATGAVGTIMLEPARAARASRPTRSCPSPPSARPASELARSRPSSRSTTTRSRASTSRCSQRRRRDLARVGAALRRRGRDGGRQLDRPGAWTPTCRSWSPRSTPTRSTTSARASSPTRTARRWRSCCPLKALHDAFGLHDDGRAPASRPPAAPARRASTSSRRRSTARRTTRTTLVSDGASRCGRGRAQRPRQDAGLQRRAVARHPGRRAATATRRSSSRTSRARSSSIPELSVSPTCVRVPVMVGHAIEVRATFDRARHRRRRARGAARLPEPRAR